MDVPEFPSGCRPRNGREAGASGQGSHPFFSIPGKETPSPCTHSRSRPKNSWQAEVLNAAIVPSHARRPWIAAMAVVFFFAGRGISCLLDGPHLVAFRNDFGNCSGSVRGSHRGGADRDHWEGPRTASRAFVGRPRQVCISRSETRNLH